MSSDLPRFRQFGPVRLIDASLARQLLGFVLAWIGLDILVWAVQAAVQTPVLTSVIAHTALGTFVIFNGLYLGGVRFR